MKIPGKIPILIRPSFWLVAALIGFLYSRDFVGAAMWTFVIFISVLFHELGHAITALFCGMKPRIELVAMGGMTFHEGDSLPFTKRFLIVFNGPFFGFLLFLFSSYLLSFPTL
ncbi:MAG: stage IV sporulation protein FB, partial [Chlamydiae bacterium]|nr:stage IV sporulation protein FB [Chlamydiota bacterium]